MPFGPRPGAIWPFRWGSSGPKLPADEAGLMSHRRFVTASALHQAEASGVAPRDGSVVDTWVWRNHDGWASSRDCSIARREA